VDGVSVGVRLLHGSEVHQIRREAVEHCKEHKIDLVMDPEFLDLVIMRLTVLNVCYDVDDKQAPFFKRDDVFKIDAPLARTLYELYIAHQQAMDPLAYCSAEKVEELVAALGKYEMSVARLSLFDLPTLRSLCISMAHLLRSK
jgi:hypothetical protein